MGLSIVPWEGDRKKEGPKARRKTHQRRGKLNKWPSGLWGRKPKRNPEKKTLI